MALLTVQYTAPLPTGFVSGTVELKAQTVYVDAGGLTNQPYRKYTLGADKSLTSLQGDATPVIVGMAAGDPATAGPLDVVVTITVSGLPTPLRSTFQVPALDTGGSTLNLHAPNTASPVVAPFSPAIVALVGSPTDRKFVSANAANPISPAAADLTTYPGNIYGSRFLASGAAQLTLWNRTASAWADFGAPSATKADTDAALAAANSASGTAVTANSTANTANTKATAVQSAISNTASSQLASRATADGPQFVDGSRWTWSSTGTPNGGTVVAGVSGYWMREFAGAASALWFGVKGDGSSEGAAIIAAITAVRDAKHPGIFFPRPTSFYNLGTAGYIANTGDNVSIEFHPQAIIRGTGDGSQPLLWFENVGANFSLRGGSYGYATQPTTRGGGATIQVSGNAMQNVRLENLNIQNSANFGLWALGTVPPPYVAGQIVSGCNGLFIRGCAVRGTMGDGLHAENWDSDVWIEDNRLFDCGDDSIAVNNATVSGFPHQHPAFTYNVTVCNNHINNPTFGSVRLGGISNGDVYGNVIRGGSRSNISACIAFPLGLDASYGPSNEDICYHDNTVQNVWGLGFMFAGTGSNYQRRIRFHANNGTGLLGTGIYIDGRDALNKNTPDIEITDNTLRGAASNAGQPIFISQVNGLHVRNLLTSGFAQTLQISSSIDVDVEHIENRDPVAACDGITFTSNARLRYRALIAIDGQVTKRLANGLKITNNTDVRGFGGCEVSGQTATAVVGGSNGNPSGFLDEITDFINVGTVTTNQVVRATYTRAPLNGGYCLIAGITVVADTMIRFVARNSQAAFHDNVFGDASTGVLVHYTVRGILA